MPELYPYGAKLSGVTHRGVAMSVTAEAGTIRLDVLDYRPSDPMRPRGLRRFRPSVHQAPTFTLTGRFHEDVEHASAWLAEHRAAILAAESVAPDAGPETLA